MTLPLPGPARALLALLALAAASPAPAQAWSDPGLGLGAAVSYTSGRNAVSPFTSGDLHLRYRLTGSVGLEGTISYRRETLEQAGAEVLDCTEVPVTIGLQLFFLPSTRIQPYLVAGGGYYWVRVTGVGVLSGTGASTESQFAFHAGAGVEARTSRRSSIHADVRYHFLELNALQEATDTLGTTLRAGYLAASAGVTLYF